MEKAKQVAQIRSFRDDLKEYMRVCNQVWQARNEYRSAEKSVLAQEKAMREKLTEEWGRLEQLFLKITAPIHSFHPATGITRPIFDEALSANFEGSLKGDHLESAIGAATKAIGLIDALSESQYKGIYRSTPNIFIGHSFLDEHKSAVAQITKFVGSFPVSITTGEKPTLVGINKGVSEKVKHLIDEADLIIAILTKDESLANNHAVSSKWVSDEIAYAIGKGKTIIRLIENGVDYKPALSGDAEYISFEKENLGEAFLKLSELFNSLPSK